MYHLIRLSVTSALQFFSFFNDVWTKIKKHFLEIRNFYPSCWFTFLKVKVFLQTAADLILWILWILILCARGGTTPLTFISISDSSPALPRLIVQQSKNALDLLRKIVSLEGGPSIVAITIQSIDFVDKTIRFYRKHYSAGFFVVYIVKPTLF